MKLLSLQGNDSTKIKNTKTVPGWYLILIVQMSISNGQIYKHLIGNSACRTSKNTQILLVEVGKHPQKVCVQFGIVLNSFHHQLQTKIKTGKQEEVCFINKTQFRILNNIALINDKFLLFNLMWQQH